MEIVSKGLNYLLFFFLGMKSGIVALIYVLMEETS